MLAVEFCVEKPQGGIRFIRRKPFEAASNHSDVYLATVDHNNGHPLCYWFPCVSSLSEPCTWKIEVLVDKDATVIASGNLIEVESFPPEIPETTTTTTTNQLKKFHYFMSVPTVPANLGLVVGRFDSMSDESLPEVSYYYDAPLKSLVKETCACMSDVFEFYEETFSFHFPFGSHKLVFLPDLAEDYLSFSSLSILK